MFTAPQDVTDSLLSFASSLSNIDEKTPSIPIKKLIQELLKTLDEIDGPMDLEACESWEDYTESLINNGHMIAPERWTF